MVSSFFILGKCFPNIQKRLLWMRTAAYNVDVKATAGQECKAHFVLENKDVNSNKEKVDNRKDMAILFSYVVNKINRIIMQKMHWRYLRIAELHSNGVISCISE